MKPLYLTTTLPYVNAAPHIGFALEIVQADSVARYARHLGRPVFFNFGSDEHGQKIWEKAQTEGKDTQEYVDYFASQFQDLRESLNLSYDNFVRTTDPHHKVAAQEVWKRCESKGDIYKAEYESKYCVGCELEKTDSELENGECPLHPGKELEIRSEENYFFRFSAYEEKLRELWKRDDFVVPDHRLNEMRSLLEKEGLKDFSISRPVSKMSWGVPVPGDNGHVMYVWFDALVNYVSTLGWPNDLEQFNQFWNGENNIQFAGKDQVRQQAAMWQAMLISADLPTTNQIFIHGFIGSNGQKMSKSLGNVVDPFSVVEKYGTDALRYFLLRHIHPTEDSDWTTERFHENYMASLVGGIGNLTNRILKMASSAGVSLETKPQVHISDDLINYRFNDYMNDVWREVGEADKFISDEAPYKKVKEDPRSADDDFRYLLEKLYTIAKKLEFVMPETSAKILEAIEKNEKPTDPIFPRVEL